MKYTLLTLSFLFILNCGFANNNRDSLFQVIENPASNYKDRVSAYSHLMKIYSRISLDSSILFSNKALELAINEQDFSQIVKSCNNNGVNYSLSGQMDKALDSYNEGLKFAKKSPSDTLVSFALEKIGQHFMRLQQMDTAIVIFKKSLNASTTKTNTTLSTLCLLAAAYSNLSENGTAQLVLSEARHVNKSIKSDFYDAKINYIIGTAYQHAFDYDKALKYFMESLELSKKINNEQLIQYSYDGIVRMYNNTDQYEKAITITKESLAYYSPESNINSYASMYRQLASSYSSLGKLDTALVYLNKSLELKKEIHDSLGICLVYSRMAKVYMDMKNYPLAEDYFLKSLKINTNFPHYFNQAFCYAFLGDLYLIKDTKEWPKQQLTNELSVAVLNGNNEKTALTFFEKSLSVSIEYKIDAATKQVYKSLYTYYKKKKNYKNALFNFEKYIEVNDSINSQESQIAIEELTTKYEVNKKENQIGLLQKDNKLKELLFRNEQEKNSANQQFMFLGFGFGLLLVLIIILIFRQKQKNKINAIENKSLKVETQMLRSQMNPHFIFNSLNSIQSFISGNDTIDAERYLSKFSKLMRLILDNSRKPYIVFENEINTLKLYLELEKLRFDDQFEYEINYTGIDEEFTFVPPMLAQPYIENAVLHGIRKVKNGKITVDYKVEGKKMICTIDDNGIGRKKSLDLKTALNKKKSSLGIKVTEERIELLAKELNLVLEVKIIDKLDSNNKAIGTKVIIQMPWKD